MTGRLCVTKRYKVQVSSHQGFPPLLLVGNHAKDFSLSLYIRSGHQHFLALSFRWPSFGVLHSLQRSFT